MRGRHAFASGLLVAACTAGEPRSDAAGAADTASPPESAAAAVRPGGAAPAWTIGVAGATGTLDATTARAAIGAQFEGSVVRDSLIPMGEGQTEPGTIIHPDDPLRRIEIVWLDSSAVRPARIQVRGDSSLWSVGSGITLGTSLEQLEVLNGRPFTLTGFGWDYGGTVMGWEEGALEQALLGGDGRVLLRLATGSSRALPPEVSGDGVFRSDLPAMRELEPVVREIIVEYDVPGR